MDKILEKIARQILAFDEASLASLWEKYATRAKQFEPTKSWEEAVIIVSIIQGMQWKNQLFNYHWKEAADPDQAFQSPLSLPEQQGEQSKEKQPLAGASSDGKSGKILPFRPRKNK